MLPFGSTAVTVAKGAVIILDGAPSGLSVDVSSPALLKYHPAGSAPPFTSLPGFTALKEGKASVILRAGDQTVRLAIDVTAAKREGTPQPESLESKPPASGPTSTPAPGSSMGSKTEGTSASISELVVGLPLSEAESVAEQAGYSVRVIERDGEPLPSTKDFREDRVNVAVEGGVVTSAEIG